MRSPCAASVPGEMIVTMPTIDVSCPFCQITHVVKVDDSDRYGDKLWVDCPELPFDYQFAVHRPKGMPMFVDIERRFFEGLLEGRREVMAWVAAGAVTLAPSPAW